ncbi:MAG: hypothetical protein ABSH28_15635 [Acidobacteriota bacterium]|jgi:hypothetical protein
MTQWRAMVSIVMLLGAYLWPGRLPAQAQQPDKPLPELNEFLKGVRAHLESDRLLLSQYTYNEKETERALDDKGKVKSTHENIFEVYPSLEEGLTYRRLISKDGKPLDKKVIEKQDREQDKKERDWTKKLEREGTDERARRLAKEAEEKRKEQEAIDELFQLYRIELAGREILDGSPAIVLTFTPHSDYKPHTDEGKILAKVAGRAWICEDDYQVIRVEAKLIDNISFGMGVLARLNKGAIATFQRRRVNNEIWLPAEVRFTGNARVLLLKGLRLDVTSVYSDYTKFTVETQVKFRKDKNP